MSMKVSPRVVFLALVAATGGILFGYDTAVISGTTEVVKAQFGLSAGGEGWYVGCALIGSILGVAIAGMLSDFLGRKKTMLISAVLFSISAIGCAVSADFTQLVIFRIVGGFGIGIREEHRSYSLPCKDLKQKRMRFPSIKDMDPVDTVVDGIRAVVKLGKHSASYISFLDKAVGFGYRKP